MEEYFAPHGTDHQILDGREARWRSSFFLYGVILAAVLILGGSLWMWWWQRSVVFFVPKDPLTIVATREGRSWIAHDKQFPTPAAWKVEQPARLLGGQWTHPTWMIVPRWTRRPSEWTQREAHGLYKLLVLNDSTATSTRGVTLRDRRSWRLAIADPLIYGTVQDGEQSFSYTFNGTILATSLPQLPAQDPLPTGFDGALLVQASPFTRAFLASAHIETQGLAPWRSVLHSIAWNAPSGTISDYDIRFTTTSALGDVLSSSTTKSFIRSLQDGSSSERFVAAHTTSTLSVHGSSNSQAPVTCTAPGFSPFFRLQGASLQYTWSRIGTPPPASIEVGALNDYLSICFTSSPSVDK